VTVLFYAIVAIAVSAVFYFVGQLNYPLVHSGIELFSVVVGCSIFAIAWNARKQTGDNYFLIVGTAYLFIAIIDVLHTLAFKGIDIFGTGGSNLPTQLWIAARFLQAVTLLAAPVLLDKKIQPGRVLITSAVLFVAVTSLIFTGNFPAAFVEGTGLTLFKKMAEYVISLCFIGSAVLLYRKRNHFDKRVFLLITGSIYATIASELAFTLYADPFGLLNLVGHIFKAGAFYLLYKGIITTALTNPISLLYNNLKQNEEAIRISEERLTKILETNVDGLVFVNELGTIVFANQAARDMLSIDDSDLGVKTYFDLGLSLIPITGDSLNNSHLYFESVEDSIRYVFSTDTPIFDIELLIAKQDDQLITISENAAPLHDGNGDITGAVISIRDITEQKNSKEMLNYLAYYDAITGLPNRSLLSDRLDMVIAQASRKSEKFAVLYLDLDNFKIVNDSIGHNAGDQLIRITASLFENCLRKSDTVARVGGDEFVVVLPEIENESGIDITVDKIMKAIRHPIMIDDHEFYVSASIGISIYPQDGEDVHTLLKNADAALYKAKELGRNTHVYYMSSMNNDAMKRLTLENDLRKAIPLKQMVLHYQPLVDFKTNEIIGMEALIRWNHPELGLVPPVEFIGVAEETGLINSIGNWVLNEACKQNKAWQNAGYKPIRISVNVSARQFHRNDLVTQVKQALSSSGLAPEYLEVEITESVLMHDKEDVAKILEELREMGVHIALDDFGTGYSSLSYLKNLPIGKLKIDQDFIRSLLDRPDDTALVSSIISMAQNLRLRAVAEGVETESQFDMLHSLNCSEMQGYLFSKPLPSSEVTKLLGEQEDKKKESA
jgi:diguanylate cyclase (GGDEF)-like protein/PAS domain S-box-containing protein